jgi:hypothetical protein
MPDNQTRDEWLELPVVANDPNAKGTGVYIPQAGGMKDYAIDITYDNMLSRHSAEKFYAFSGFRMLWRPFSKSRAPHVVDVVAKRASDRVVYASAASDSANDRTWISRCSYFARAWGRHLGVWLDDPSPSKRA